MKIAADDYDLLRRWAASFLKWVKPFGENIADDIHPITILDQMASQAPARARQGLALMISDLLEDSASLTTMEIQTLDQKLADADLPTLSELRMRFSKTIARIVKRGAISSDNEYYFVRSSSENAAEGDAGQLWQLIEAYEEKIAASRH
jgi:hypothetical protein